MKKRDLFEIQWKAEELSKGARDISALIVEINPRLSERFLKMANFAAGFATFLRIHESLPPDLAAPAKPPYFTSVTKPLLIKGGK